MLRVNAETPLFSGQKFRKIVEHLAISKKRCTFANETKAHKSSTKNSNNLKT
jgi:hypothetical protein